jgi:hypothetical protein
MASMEFVMDGSVCWWLRGERRGLASMLKGSREVVPQNQSPPAGIARTASSRLLRRAVDQARGWIFTHHAGKSGGGPRTRA